MMAEGYCRAHGVNRYFAPDAVAAAVSGPPFLYLKALP